MRPKGSYGNVTQLRYDPAVESEAPAMDDGLSAFERTRPRLFGIA
jgi:hypothetical protein